MKIRIKGNTLRLRLSQTEVDKISKNGYVDDCVQFLNGKLLYCLQRSENTSIAAEYSSDRISVLVPHEQLMSWARSEQVGLSEQVSLNGPDSLSVLIEKDFQCMMPRDGEDEKDLYKNPMANNEA